MPRAMFRLLHDYILSLHMSDIMRLPITTTTRAIIAFTPPPLMPLTPAATLPPRHADTFRFDACLH